MIRIARAAAVAPVRGARPRRADRQQRRLLERVERRDLCQGRAREEIRDHVAAILVVPVVPRHEPRDLGQPRGARRAEGQVHPGLRRPGQPARHLAALRALGLARHHHLRARRHRDRQAARLLFAAVLHPDPEGDDRGPLAGRSTAMPAARSASARWRPASPTRSAPRSWPSSTRPRTRPMAAGARASSSTARRSSGRSSSAPRRREERGADQERLT